MEISAVKRVGYLDIVRVVACFMVVLIHINDPYVAAIKGDSFLAGSVYACLMRPSVPLFVMLSGVLLLPIKNDDNKNFFRKRFTRIFFPFVFWALVYYLAPLFYHNGYTLKNAFDNIVHLPVNFTKLNIHYWFMYIIIGLYLFMPIISPWIKNASKKALQWFLFAWGITLLLPFVRLYYPTLWGEAVWNEFELSYYFSGYIGYLVLGLYIHKYDIFTSKRNKIIALVTFLAMVFVTTYLFYYDSIAIGKCSEFVIGNLTINVALMTTVFFGLFQGIELKGKVEKIWSKLSELSFGVFLVHYLFIDWILSLGFGIMNPWLEVPVLTLLVFALSYLLVYLISKLPFSKYITG